LQAVRWSALFSRPISTKIVPYLLLNSRPELTLKPCSLKTLILLLPRYNTLASLHLPLNSSGGNVSGSYQPFSPPFCNPVYKATSPTDRLTAIETKMSVKKMMKILEIFYGLQVWHEKERERESKKQTQISLQINRRCS
jgi:hypothetical protein